MVNSKTKTSKASWTRYNPSKEQILSMASLPLKEAADALCIGTTKLKDLCRRYGIPKWPRRQRLLQARLNEFPKMMDSVHTQFAVHTSRAYELAHPELVVRSDATTTATTVAATSASGTTATTSTAPTRSTVSSAAAAAAAAGAAALNTTHMNININMNASTNTNAKSTFPSNGTERESSFPTNNSADGLPFPTPSSHDVLSRLPPLSDRWVSSFVANMLCIDSS